MPFVRTYVVTFFFVLALLLLAFISPNASFAQSKEDIQAQIEQHNQKIQDLEKEISTYQQQLNVIGTQKTTLQSAIKTLDVSRQQTSTQINVTQNKIAATNLKLQELSGAISEKEYLIQLDKKTVAISLRDIAETDGASMVEQLFSTETLAEAWKAVDDRATLSNALREHAENLSAAKQQLAEKQTEESGKKVELTTHKTELTTQKTTLDVQKSEKDKLLAVTKNQESTYQALIAKKRAEQKTFEAALSALENRLQSVGSGAIPAVGQG
ncbi:MAG: hypothetical protein AAB901_02510, partial [Patescibacteria group bacterium]